MRTSSRCTLATALWLAALSASAAPWTYRGSLNDGGVPANGSYDVRLTLRNPANSAAIAGPLTLYSVPVKDGQFAVDVDFGLDLVNAPVLSLQTEVQQGSSGFVALGEPTRFDAKAAFGSVCWDTSGNTGSDPNVDFLGTTDAQPLVLRTRNVQSLRIEPSSILFNGAPITANVIAGSSVNTVAEGVRGATIAGGGNPLGNSDPAFFNEGPNRVTDNYGSVGGGYNNQAGDAAGSTSDSPFATVGGGNTNTASSSASTVGGGANNTANGANSTIAGGSSNTASGEHSTVGGGFANDAVGLRSTVSGGDNNTATGGQSTVVGGFFNWATGQSSTAGGGDFNCAGGDFSWAAGIGARTRHGNEPGDGACFGSPNSGDGNGDEGSFVWAGSMGSIFTSTGPNQFGVRTAGVFFGAVNAASVLLPAGRFINTASGAHLTTGGTWTNASSRTLKTAFEDVDPLAVLGKVASLPLRTWAYKDSVEGRHLGPVAEDFKALFGLGGDGTSIATVDADGVALAAIQGLNQKLEAENAALRAELAEHDRAFEAQRAQHAQSQAQSAAFEARLRALEAQR